MTAISRETVAGRGRSRARGKRSGTGLAPKPAWGNSHHQSRVRRRDSRRMPSVPGEPAEREDFDEPHSAPRAPTITGDKREARPDTGRAEVRPGTFRRSPRVGIFSLQLLSHYALLAAVISFSSIRGGERIARTARLRGSDGLVRLLPLTGSDLAMAATDRQAIPGRSSQASSRAPGGGP